MEGAVGPTWIRFPLLLLLLALQYPSAQQSPDRCMTNYSRIGGDDSMGFSNAAAILSNPGVHKSTPGRHSVPLKPRTKRVAICLFGQVKNLNATHTENFAINILRPLQEAHSHVDIFMHTYNVSKFTNPRNGEDNVDLDIQQSIKLLIQKVNEAEVSSGTVSFKEIKISEVEDADVSFRDLRYYLLHGDPWDNQGLSMRYFLRQLFSLDQVTQLWENRHIIIERCLGVHEEKSCLLIKKEFYDLVIYTRPDLLFFDELPNPSVRKIEEHDAGICSHEKWKLQAHTIYTATFDEFNGLNDRFAIGTPSVMRHYGHRAHLIESYFERYPGSRLWAEPFLYKIMVEMLRIEHAPISDFRFTRIRADGRFGAT